MFGFLTNCILNFQGVVDLKRVMCLKEMISYIHSTEKQIIDALKVIVWLCLHAMKTTTSNDHLYLFNRDVPR